MRGIKDDAKDADKPIIGLQTTKGTGKMETVKYPPGMSRDAAKKGILKYEKSNCGLTEFPFKVIKDFPELEVDTGSSRPFT